MGWTKVSEEIPPKGNYLCFIQSKVPYSPDISKYIMEMRFCPEIGWVHPKFGTRDTTVQVLYWQILPELNQEMEE